LTTERPPAEYLDAVEEYATAFDIVKAEEIRKPRSDFSRDEQPRLAHAHSAQRIAADNCDAQNVNAPSMSLLGNSMF
jgi:hypothetical protein